MSTGTAGARGPVTPSAPGTPIPTVPVVPITPTVPTTPGDSATEPPRTPMVIDECASAVAAEVASQLQSPMLPDSTSRWLYPYEGTVFPRGLPAPVLQWQAPSDMPSAVMVQLHSQYLDYRLCAPLTEPMRFSIPQSAWELAAAQSAGRSDPLTVQVTLGTATSAARLPPLTLTFALADLKGAIYYNTYGSTLAINAGITGGVVMRVLPREPQPVVFASANGTADQCIGCHSVSADGSRMVAELHEAGGIIEGPSRSFDLTSVGVDVNPTPIRSDLRRAGFSGVYPDGSVYLTTGRIAEGVGTGSSFNGAPGNITGTFGAEEAKLYDMATGQELPNSGIHPYAYMPTFSIDGTQVVFNKMDASATTGHNLAVMDFDRAANTFSNLRDVFSDTTRFPSWPFYLPDVVIKVEENVVQPGKRVLFALNSNSDFLTGAVSFGTSPPTADLWLLDVTSGTAAALNRANGLDAMGNSYLPYGENDAHSNFVPTVSPVAAGGYFWVFFSSKRSYGNLLVVDPALQGPEAKKIWVAAIDVDAAPGVDSSHPAFFLPNQELDSGNIRAFAALEPCRQEGAACTSGVDCCCGYCLAEAGATQGSCGCEPNRCANYDEKCTSAADCCDPDALCIGGFCESALE
ncbi:MAG: hypothetical protein ABW321_06380 [Polyangiales bacterium]